MVSSKAPKRRWWIAGAALAVGLLIVAWYVVPILTHPSGGSSGQSTAAQDYPSTVTATGTDGRTRTLAAYAEDGTTPADLSDLANGSRLVVTGSGYDIGTGIYVAVCKKPADATQRPTPCIGGVPHVSEGQEAAAWAASAWINDSLNWRLFGAQAYGDGGTFTARISAGSFDSGLDCRVEHCAIYTRADHTALGDRTQDLYLPVAFAD